MGLQIFGWGEDYISLKVGGLEGWMGWMGLMG